jgi:hypothetical protein
MDFARSYPPARAWRFQTDVLLQTFGSGEYQEYERWPDKD